MWSSGETYMKLVSIAVADLFRFFRQPSEEQEPAEAVFSCEGRDAEEGDGGEEGEGELSDGIEGPLVAGIAVGAGEYQVGYEGEADVEDEKHGPRQPSSPQTRII